MSANNLEKEYATVRAVAEQFAEELVRQLNELLAQGGISLGFPIQYRVKTWESIADKLQRRSLNLNSIRELNDLIGLRVLLLFQRDVETVCQLVKNNFSVISHEDTRERLGANEFGYTSVHFLVVPPESWLALPTLKQFRGLKAEIQVRTVAQHIWAATSHALQYKQEQSVPLPLRRAISRVSAILETVDLEVERVLAERTSYLAKADAESSSEQLNVDLLAKVMDENLPAKNKKEPEAYSELLEDLLHFSIKTPKDLVALLKKHRDALIEREESIVNQREPRLLVGYKIDKQRLAQGVFFTHVGMVRNVMHEEFGDEWEAYAPVLTKRMLQKRKLLSEGTTGKSAPLAN